LTYHVELPELLPVLRSSPTPDRRLSEAGPLVVEDVETLELFFVGFSSCFKFLLAGGVTWEP